MKFKLGDKVSFLNDVGGGVIKRITDDIAFVEDETGFEMPYPLKELVPVNPHQESLYRDNDAEQGYAHKDIPERFLKAKKQDFQQKYQDEKKGGRIEGDFMEVDLHIHEILDSNRNLSNSEMIAVQMAHFERMMKMAMARNMRKVVFIHGVGKGVLKSEIRRALSYYPNCNYHDAPYHEYGYGATEVLIW